MNAELEKFKDNLDASLNDLAVLLKEEPRQMGTAARAWLKQLASSSLRDHVGVEAKLAIAYESPQGWANFWSLSQALKEGKPFAGKEVAKEERETLAAECMDLLRLYTRDNQLRVPVAEFVRIAKALELQKGFGTALSDLAADPQFRRYYEALRPDAKKGAIDSLKHIPDANSSSELLTEASKLRGAIEQAVKEIADSDLMIAPHEKQKINPEMYDDLADLLLIDWVRGKSPAALFTGGLCGAADECRRDCHRNCRSACRRGCVVSAVSSTGRFPSSALLERSIRCCSHSLAQ